MNDRHDALPDGYPLRICFVMLHYARDAASNDARRYLRETPIHSALPEAVAALGHEVHLVHQFPSDQTFSARGVRYHFVAERGSMRRLSRLAGRLRQSDPAFYEPALRTIDRVRALEPDILHVHGTTLNLNLYLLFRRLGRAASPALLHYHGGYPARSALGRRMQRFNFAHAQRYAFTTRDQAQPFIETGFLDKAARIVPLVETSSTFRRLDRLSARHESGMTGEPVCLSVGRLHAIKDPLTMLQGFEQVLVERPKAQLYLYYLTDEERPALEGYLATRPALRDHVHFRGRAPFEQMESIYNSADFLLQASRREFSGCAVLEALACGVIPIVSDISSFRVMTECGRFGALFPVGDAQALAQRITEIPLDMLEERSAAIRAHFERNLSFDAMARQLLPVYCEMLAERGCVR
jgi:glycosyltransferase involved in cell wall biosynthesis